MKENKNIAITQRNCSNARVKNNSEKKLAISQILILVVGIIAISYLVGSEIKSVGATGGINPSNIKIPLNIPVNPSSAQIIQAVGAPAGMAGSSVIPQGAVMISAKSASASILTNMYAVAGISILVAMGIAAVFGGINGKDALAIAKAGGQSLGAAAATQWAVKQFGKKYGMKILGKTLATKIAGFAGPVGLIVFGGTFIWQLVSYKKEEFEVVEFHCYPWDSSIDEQNCEKCNNQGDLPCSIYQCKSLGQSCELINEGTDEELCVYVNPKDTNYPTITPLEDALINEHYSYDPTGLTFPTKQDRGVNIEYDGGCIPAFTPFSFGVKLNEPARCKISSTNERDFESMGELFLSESRLRYEHEFSMSLPNGEALADEEIEVKNGGIFEVYVRCEDKSGNYNPGNFVFKYCVDEGPDTQAPVIVTTSILSDSPIAYGQEEIDLTLYVNEPSTCKWSHLDQPYDDMPEEMDCSLSVTEMNAQNFYECDTTLTGLNDNVENDFYFRCKDKPLKTEDRIENSESYKFTLVGTQPLVIDEVKPNGTIKDSTSPVKVTFEARTSAGYNEGDAICYLSSTGESNDYTEFRNTNSYTHSQDLYLESGIYEYYIKCVDLGGNSDTEIVNFEVESDNYSPIVVRAYKDGTNLRVVTNEKSNCVYSTFGCNYLFEDGTKMIVLNDVENYVAWNTQNDLYIKCSDEYGNKPASDECSIVVRPFDLKN